VGNVDPTLDVTMGFVGTSFVDGYMKPVLGVEAREKQ